MACGFWGCNKDLEQVVYSQHFEMMQVEMARINFDTLSYQTTIVLSLKTANRNVPMDHMTIIK